MTPEKIETITRLLAECDSVLIGAGAGLTAAAGISYVDREAFARVFPAWKRRGYSMQYELVGNPNLAPLEKWGYWVAHLNYVYYGQGANPLYQKLRGLVTRKEWFVMTSNVDELFHKSGFDEKRIYSPQGSYGLIQCEKPCTQTVWDMKPYMERMEAAYDPVEQVLTDPAAVPVCPDCGGTMFPNVRKDGGMIDRHFMPGRERLLQWLKEQEGKKVLLLELGSGFNTPVVIRMPMESIAESFPGSTLVRVNLDHPEIPWDFKGRGISIDGDIAAFINTIDEKRAVHSA